MSNIAHMFVRGKAVADLNRVPVSAVTAGGSENYGIDPQGRTRVALPEKLFDGRFKKSSYNATLWTWEDDSGESEWGVVVNNYRARFYGSTEDAVRAMFASRATMSLQSGFNTMASFTGIPFSSGTAPATGVGYVFWGFGKYYSDQGLGIGFVFDADGVHVTMDEDGEPLTLITPDDPLDGSGASGKTADLTKRQTMWIEFDWSGSAIVFGATIDRERVIVHRVQLDDALVFQEGSKYRAMVAVKGSLYESQLYSASVDIEGGGDRPRGQIYSASRTQPLEDLGPNERWLLAIRVNSGVDDAGDQAVVRRVCTTNLKGAAHVQYRLIRLFSPDSGEIDAALGDGQLGVVPAALDAAQPAGQANYQSNVETCESDGVTPGLTGALNLSAVDYQVVATHFDLNDGVVLDNIDTRLTFNLKSDSDVFIVTAKELDGNGKEAVTCAIDWEEF